MKKFKVYYRNIEVAEFKSIKECVEYIDTQLKADDELELKEFEIFQNILNVDDYYEVYTSLKEKRA